MALQFADREQCKDEFIIMDAVQKNGLALQFASQYFKNKDK